MTTFYRNTRQNAEIVGWARVPEYCSGDTRPFEDGGACKYVFHDMKNGKFTFMVWGKRPAPKNLAF